MRNEKVTETQNKEFMSRRRWMLTFDSQQLFMLGKPRTIISEG